MRCRRLLITTALLLVPVAASAQRQKEPGPTLARLLSRVHAGDAASVQAFWDSIVARGTPLMDPLPDDTTKILASFVYRSDTIQNVVLENGVNGWAYILNQLERVPGTDIWHITVAVPADIRLGYVFRANDDLIPWALEPNQGRRWAQNRPDPFNPRVDSAQNRRSLLLGPRARPDTWSQPQSDVAHGKIENLDIDSRALGTRRRFGVYTPPVPALAGLPLLVVFDGPTYRSTVRVPDILDNLLAAGRIAPVVAVFVNQTNRMVELAPNPGFTEYVTGELIPFVRARYGLASDAAHTIVMGSSHGGLAADWMAIAHPEVVGNVISQSASLWWSPASDPEPEYLARLVAKQPKTAVRYWLEVGTFEIDRTAGNSPGQVDVNRHFRDVLNAKGYDVAYSEFPGGHEYQSWRVTTPSALMHFLGSTR